MQKITLPYIEDYLEIMTGYATTSSAPPLVLSLARYDIQILNSMASQTIRGVALTDRQALLAHKLVVKYKRQLATHGIDTGFHDDDAKFRMPTRTMDRSRTISYSHTRAGIVIRFPYDDALINIIRESTKTIPGELKFDHTIRAWVAAVTEPRIIWLQDLIANHQFEVDDTISQYMEKVLECQQQTFKIELSIGTAALEISNAADSLVNYINEKVKGFDFDNILNLVDYSSVLEYTVDPSISHALVKQYPDTVYRLLTNNTAHIPLTTPNCLEEIFQYAELTNRWPVYVYENTQDLTSNNTLLHLQQYFKQDEILSVGNRQRKMDPTGYRCIYITNWQPSWTNRIPLLITLTAMMAGPRKQQIIQCSEKVVYCTGVVYNPS